MRTIKNVQSIGIYPEEVRIVSKDEKPATFNRNTRSLSVTDIERVKDEIQGGERRVIIQFKESMFAHCEINEKEILCGEYISR
jgi:hypothetical protein